MHGLVPPHPGPLIAINALGANLGQTMAYGLLIAIPTVILAGPIYGGWIGRRVQPVPPERLVAQFTQEPVATGATSSAAATSTAATSTAAATSRVAATSTAAAANLPADLPGNLAAGAGPAVTTEPAAIGPARAAVTATPAPTGTATTTTAAAGLPTPATAADGPDTRPGFGVTLATVLLPVVLMLGKALADILLPKSNGIRVSLDFVGDPLVALLLAVLVAMFTFGYLRGFSRQKVSDLLGLSLAPIAAIVMIIGAGGGFKQILVSIGIGDALGKAAAASGLSALVLGWLIAVGIRLATGSATVATVTAAGLMAPLVAQLHDVNRPLLALAIGSGSLFLSHVNDAGFWLVKEYFGMTVGQTFKTWSAMETIISVVSFVLIMALSLVV
jgi:GntP family gluconate:H+ symporter